MNFRVCVLLSVLAFLVTATSAHAVVPGITGTYSTSGEGALAGWTFGARLGGDSDGSIPARLTTASAPDVVRPCDAIEGMGTLTTRVAGIADPAARLRLAIRLNLRRGTGQLTLHHQVQSSGQVLSHEITACTPPADGMNGTVSNTYDAALLFPSLAIPRAWPLLRARDGSWRTQSAQSRGGQTHRASVRLVGSAAAMNAGCFVPTDYQMRLVRSFTQAHAFVARDGFTRSSTATRPSLTVPRGRFFIAERTTNEYMPCGSRSIAIVRSSGRP
ncbi:MAG: hypothetical protein M3P52_06000 [Actinomycetota bacterium]|nr:hypothetical protein [Actinomycetota bacterium]